MASTPHPGGHSLASDLAAATRNFARAAFGRARRLARNADIVIAAVGRPRLIDASWLKPGAVVIDVGINRIDDDGRSRLVGDVDFAAALPHVAAITPVPGGVGPMTIAMLMQNTVRAAESTLN